MSSTPPHLTLGQAIVAGDLAQLQAAIAAEHPDVRRLNRALLNQCVGDPLDLELDPDLPRLPRDKRLEVARCLLEVGAQIDNTDTSAALTMTHVAVIESDFELLDLAVEFGTRAHLPAVPTTHSLHPLLYGILYGCDPRMLQRLVELGADVNEQDWMGENAVGFAVQQQKRETIDVLLDLGGDLNWQNKQGKTPLLSHFQKLPPELVLHLIQRGADLRAPDENGDNALDYADKYPCPAADAIRAYRQAQALDASIPSPQGPAPRSRL